MSFGKDLERFTRNTGKKADTVVRRLVFAIGDSLINMSPVGDPKRWKHPESAPPGYVGGRFRGNWQHGFNDYQTTTFETIDPEGKASRARIKGSVPTKAAGGVHYIINNLPYSLALEYGHSSQAPAPGGMVGITALKFQQYLDKAGRGL